MILNDTRDIQSQCQIVLFNWVDYISVGNQLPDQDLATSTMLDVSKYVSEVNFSKNLSSPAGTFEFDLPNDRDWAAILQVGTWGIIYMSQSGDLSIPIDSDTPDLSSLINQRNKIRAIIHVDRIAVKTSTSDDRGTFDAEFTVSGRDFGVVYEETQIFLNRLYSEGLYQQAFAANLNIADNRGVGNLVKFVHQGFLSPADLTDSLENEGSLLKNIPVQWLMPQKLFTALNISPKDGTNTTYYGNIPGLLDNFKLSLCNYPVENPMTYLNGNLWSRMKAFSIEQFHELFPELDNNGLPKLNFRYIPWRTSAATNLGALADDKYVLLLEDVDRVELTSLDLLSCELGLDNHNRFNYLLTVPETAMTSSANSINNFNDRNPGTGFPRIDLDSVKRYGLRLMFTSLNTLIQAGSEKIDPELLTIHNELMVHYHLNAYKYKNGNASIIGNEDIRIGKTVFFDSKTPYIPNMLFYIEGYTDTFVSDGNGAGTWTQSLTLTRGTQIYKTIRYSDQGEFTGKT